MTLNCPRDLAERLRAVLGEDVQFVMRADTPACERFFVGVVVQAKDGDRERVRPCSTQFEVDEAWAALTELAESGQL